MAVGSWDIAKLREILDEVCRYHNTFCLYEPLDISMVNFLASLLESWALLDEEVDFRDIVSDPNLGRVFLSMHGEIFYLAKQELYIYTKIEKPNIMKTVRKLRALTNYSRNRVVK